MNAKEQIIFRCHNLLDHWFVFGDLDAKSAEIDNIIVLREQWDEDHDGIDELIACLLEFRNNAIDRLKQSYEYKQ